MEKEANGEVLKRCHIDSQVPGSIPGPHSQHTML